MHDDDAQQPVKRMATILAVAVIAGVAVLALLGTQVSSILSTVGARSGTPGAR